MHKKSIKYRPTLTTNRSLGIQNHLAKLAPDLKHILSLASLGQRKFPVNEQEDFATVMALSGHKDISILKRYSHTQEYTKKSAIKKLGKYSE